MRVTDSILNQHAQSFIGYAMADELKKEGFASARNKGIHWFRVVNGEILQSVLFYTTHAHLPMFLEIGFASCPLFITPEIPKSVRRPAVLRGMESFNRGYPILKKHGNANFSPEVAVVCPSDEFRGLDILRGVIAQLNEIRTMRDCYEKHIEDILKLASIAGIPIKEVMYNRMSVDLMDEIVYFDDQRWYDICKRKILHDLPWYTELNEEQKLWNAHKFILNAYSHLNVAIVEGKRELHLEYLQACKENNIKMLRKKGILA